MLMCGRQRLLAALVALTALSTTVALGADDSKSGAKATGNKNQNGRKLEEALKLKCFTLKKADPEVVRQTITQLWPHLSGKKEAQHQPLVAVNPRTSSLFVRAPESALETIGELIAVLDGGSEKEVGNMGHLTLVRLRHAHAQEVCSTLSQLGLQGTVMPLPQTNLLAVAKNGHNAQEIEEIIREVDRPRSEKTASANKTDHKQGQGTRAGKVDNKKPTKDQNFSKD